MTSLNANKCHIRQLHGNEYWPRDCQIKRKTGAPSSSVLPEFVSCLYEFATEKLLFVVRSLMERLVDNHCTNTLKQLYG